MMIDNRNGNRRSRLTGHKKIEDSDISFSRTEGDPSASWVGKGAYNVVLSALTSREKTEGCEVFFSGTEGAGDSSTSSVGEGAWDGVGSVLDISWMNVASRTGRGEL